MSDDTALADHPPADEPPPPERMGRGDKVRFVLRGIGQTLITLGVVVLLFVVYEVWITNIFSRDTNNDIAHKTEQLWAQGDDPLLGLPGKATSSIPLGTGIANIYIPRLGRDYHWTIVEGTNQDDLAKGPGHYVGTALPGGKGNFAVAGHRVGKGEPFLNIDKLRVNDPIVIETKSSWFVYRVLGTPAGSNPQDSSTAVPVPGGTEKIPGREIVDPSAGRVLLPVPSDAKIAQADAVAKLLTMTTCHPKFTAAQRMIVHAELAQTYSAASNGKHVSTMPASVSALYAQGSS